MSKGADPTIKTYSPASHMCLTPYELGKRFKYNEGSDGMRYLRRSLPHNDGPNSRKNTNDDDADSMVRG